MTYDSAVPATLKKTQQWFASIILRPISDQSVMDPIAPSGRPMEEEALDFIAPSPTLRAEQRIEIYNQQYWWRLVKALHENLPLVLRLFGYYEFNQRLATPYLVKYPSDHWSLSLLAARFPKWLAEEYHEEDRQLIMHAAKLDCAFIDSFLAKQESSEILEGLSLEDIDKITDKTLHLQPHVTFFELPYDLFQFRREFIVEDPDYWLENDFPALQRFSDNETFLLFRNQFNQIEWMKVSKHEMLLLEKFREGLSIDEMCAWLESQPLGCALLVEAESFLSQWLARWISFRWLY